MVCNKEQAQAEHFILNTNGNKIVLMAKQGKYCAANQRGSLMLCNSVSLNEWADLENIDSGGGTVTLKCKIGKFVSSNGGNPMSCTKDAPGPEEMFKIVDV
jgi:hypothetical protein